MPWSTTVLLHHTHSYSIDSCVQEPKPLQLSVVVELDSDAANRSFIQDYNARDRFNTAAAAVDTPAPQLAGGEARSAVHLRAVLWVSRNIPRVRENHRMGLAVLRLFQPYLKRVRGVWNRTTW
eukprot:COSAG02_NODE_29369_length_570_cov_1.454352_1_plen_122_part_10